MELGSAKSEDFQRRGIQIIEEKGELLVLVRYPYQAGNKDFYLLNSKDDFLKFLDIRSPKELISIFSKIEDVVSGVVKEDFIKQVKSKIEKPKYTDWITLFLDIQDEGQHWYYDETKEELEESLLTNIGRSVRIIEDPEWLDISLICNGYIPDDDGVIRPGAY